MTAALPEGSQKRLPLSMTTFNWIREDEEATRIWQTNLSSSPQAIYRTRLRPPRTLFKARKSVGVDLTRSSRISLRADLCAPSRAGLRPLALRLSPFAVATCNGSFMSTPAIPERPRESRSPPKCDLRRGDPQCPLHVCAVTRRRFPVCLWTSNTFGTVKLYDHRDQPTVEIRFGQTADESVTDFGIEFRFVIIQHSARPVSGEE